MSYCSTCGEDVRWAKTPNGKIHPPLTALGPGIIVDENNVVGKAMVYEKHECSPERIEAWEDAQYRRAALAREIEKACEEAWKTAITRPCPKCYAQPQERCLNLNDVRKGVEVPRDTVWPHDPRRIG